jgi:hypothetical protein
MFIKIIFYLLYQIIDLITYFPFLTLVNIILYLIYISLIIFYSEGASMDLSFLIKN